VRSDDAWLKEPIAARSGIVLRLGLVSLRIRKYCFEKDPEFARVIDLRPLMNDQLPWLSDRFLRSRKAPGVLSFVP
jgi:hypothetical protein